MATAIKKAEGITPDPMTEMEKRWPPLKLVVLGLVTLAIAFTILWTVSPNNNP